MKISSGATVAATVLGLIDIRFSLVHATLEEEERRIRRRRSDDEHIVTNGGNSTPAASTTLKNLVTSRRETQQHANVHSSSTFDRVDHNYDEKTKGRPHTYNGAEGRQAREESDYEYDDWPPEEPDRHRPPKCHDDDNTRREDWCYDPDLTCQKACLPALCKVEEPHNNDGGNAAVTVHYVPLGESCRWWTELASSSSSTLSSMMTMTTTSPMTKPEPKVCCLTEDYRPPECTTCGDCIVPQAVNEACCNFFPYDENDNGGNGGRTDGEYEGCGEGFECCKCSHDKFKCIEEGNYCDPCESVSPTPTPPPTIDCAGADKSDYLFSILQDVPGFDNDTTAPEGLAFEWMVENDSVDVCTYPTLEQRYALVSFYYSTNGASWTSSNLWLGPNPECSWQFVTCNSNSDVTSIVAAVNNLSGNSITETIAILQSMEELDLFANSLSGPLPTAAGAMVNLRFFDVQENLFVGPVIPDEYLLWENIEQFRVSSNTLSGTIPSDVENWTKLKELWISENLLVGTLPPEIGRLVDLESLFIADNRISGTLPGEMVNLAQLEQFRAQSNLLQRSIPVDLYDMTSLQVLRLDGNILTGGVSTDIGNLVELVDLRLNDNAFTGIFPAEIQNLVDLQNLRLNNNLFEGSFPNVFSSSFTRLDFFDISSNDFNGTMPNTIFRPSAIRLLYLNNNTFTGTLSPEFANPPLLRDLWINSNRFTGTVPAISAGQLQLLNEFLLQDNDFTGSMPASICDLRMDAILDDLYSDCGGLNAEMECDFPNCCNRCFEDF